MTFDPETHMGADFISGKPIDRHFEEKIESWDELGICYLYLFLCWIISFRN